MHKEKFTINTYNPDSIFEDLIKIHEGTEENGLVRFDTYMATGVIKYVDYDQNIFAIISQIQYKVRTQFDFLESDKSKKWVKLLYNSQSCILIFDKVNSVPLSYNSNGSVALFKDKEISWQPKFDVNAPNKTIIVYLNINWLEEMGLFPINSTDIIKQGDSIKFVAIEPQMHPFLEHIFHLAANNENNPFLNKKLESCLSILSMDTLYQYFKGKKPNEQQTINSLSEEVKIQMLAIKDEMLRDFSKSKLALDDLAKLAGMNRTKFQETFKVVFNTSFYQYYQEARFNEALKLVTSKSNSINDIAATIGYKNVSFFIKEFQKRFGLTPNEYRLKL